METTIVCKSLTGNTRLLADVLSEYIKTKVQDLKNECCIPESKIVCVGFWTDKGTCDEDVQKFLSSLHDKKVFLFGTAGFGGQEDYFQAIIQRVSAYLDESNEVIGSFMCQGKMPKGVKDRYIKMLENNPEDIHIKGMIDNFEKALDHPNNEDLERFKVVIKDIFCS